MKYGLLASLYKKNKITLKILVIRFSSIGDVVLTTPVIRCLKKQLPNAEIHFITKKGFSSILQDNPNIDKLITIQSSIQEVLVQLREEKYDWIIDLHKNVRTLSLKQKLKVPSRSFPKLNVEKWLLVKMKINKMPPVHIVDRYFETVKHLGVKNDCQPCDFYISETAKIDISSTLKIDENYICVAIGAQFETKRIPFQKLIEIFEKIEDTIVILGGEMDKDLAQKIKEKLPLKKIVNTCGNFNLQQSASIVRQSKVLLTNDTGMMHIASCFQIPTVSVWGNTVPALGMYPYFPQNPSWFSMHEVADLKCRPCSKIGFQKCPKVHFNCMNLQNVEAIVEDIQSKMTLGV